MAELSPQDKSVIGKHIRNIFKESKIVKTQFGLNLPILFLVENISDGLL